MLRLLLALLLAAFSGVDASGQNPFAALGKGGKGGKSAGKIKGSKKGAERSGPPKLHPLLAERLELGPISEAEAERLVLQMMNPSAWSSPEEVDPAMVAALAAQNAQIQEAISDYVESCAEASMLRRLDPDVLRLAGGTLDIRTLRGWFVEVDFDRDSMLSFHEFRVASGLGLRHFIQLDRDPDGELSLLEFGLAVVQVADRLAYEIDPELMTSFTAAAQESAKETTGPDTGRVQPYSAPYSAARSKAQAVIDRARSQLSPPAASAEISIFPESSIEVGEPEPLTPEVLRRQRIDRADEMADKHFPSRPARLGNGSWGKGGGKISRKHGEPKAGAPAQSAGVQGGSAEPATGDDPGPAGSSVVPATAGGAAIAPAGPDRAIEASNTGDGRARPDPIAPVITAGSAGAGESGAEDRTLVVAEPPEGKERHPPGTSEPPPSSTPHRKAEVALGNARYGARGVKAGAPRGAPAGAAAAGRDEGSQVPQPIPGGPGSKGSGAEPGPAAAGTNEGVAPAASPPEPGSSAADPGHSQEEATTGPAGQDATPKGPATPLTTSAPAKSAPASKGQKSD